MSHTADPNATDQRDRMPSARPARLGRLTFAGFLAYEVICTGALVSAILVAVL